METFSDCLCELKGVIYELQLMIKVLSGKIVGSGLIHFTPGKVILYH